MHSRSRFAPTATGRPYRVTEKNIEVLSLLQRYRYLPSNYIAALLGWTGEYYKDVLTKLRHDAGLLECPNASWAAANARYRPAVYALTTKGELVLKERGLHVPRPKTGHEFNHELMVCLIRASFELGAKEHGLQLISADEILQHPHCPQTTRYEKAHWCVPVTFTYERHTVEQSVQSDGEFFGLARGEGNDRVALLFPGFEADRRTEPLEPGDYDRPSIKKKFIAYREIARQRIYQARYGLPNAIVPFVTINSAHKRSMMRVVEKLTNGSGSTLFIFKSMPNFASFEAFPPPTGHMVTEPWERVGHPPYHILASLQSGGISARMTSHGAAEASALK